MKLKQLVKLIEIGVKLWLREPGGFFFMLIFPTLLLLVFGIIYGKQFTSSGVRVIDIQVSSLIAIIIAMMGVIGIPISWAETRELGISKRLKATPMSSSVELIADIITNVIMVLISSGLVIIVGKLIFNIKFQINWADFLGAFILTCAAFFSFGLMLSVFIKTIRTASAVGNIFLFPTLFLSGIMVPRDLFPVWLQKIAEFIPLIHGVDILAGTWVGKGLNEYIISTIVLLTMTILCSLVFIKKFRQEEQ